MVAFLQKKKNRIIIRSSKMEWKEVVTLGYWLWTTHTGSCVEFLFHFPFFIWFFIYDFLHVCTLHTLCSTAMAMDLVLWVYGYCIVRCIATKIIVKTDFFLLSENCLHWKSTGDTNDRIEQRAKRIELLCYSKNMQTMAEQQWDNIEKPKVNVEYRRY